MIASIATSRRDVRRRSGRKCSPAEGAGYIPGPGNVLAARLAENEWKYYTRRYMRRPQYPIVVGSYLNEEATPQLYVPVHIAADSTTAEATIRFHRLPACPVESRFRRGSHIRSDHGAA